MRTILVFNPKGGCGKTTLATNLAAYYAGQGQSTALIDYDAQGSSTSWLGFRDADLPAIAGVPAFRNQAGMTRSFQMRTPVGTETVIVDTPAGFIGNQFSDLLKRVDVILIPVLPSLIDMAAIKGFFDDFRMMREIERSGARVGLVANRMRKNTRGAKALEQALDELPFPVVGHLRDTQHYLHATEQGQGIYELKGFPTYKDKKQLGAIVGWIENEQSVLAAGWSGLQLAPQPVPLAAGAV